MQKKIAVLIGTRPGIIKMSPIIHELRKRKLAHYVIHTGQHFSLNMDREIMKDVGLDEPDYQITRPENCVTHGQQTAYMVTNIEEVLIKDTPDILLVCGDANTNLAGALAARKLHIKVGHVEAGLRSFDWRMPEEHNRVIIDHISEYLFAPTTLAKTHLKQDGVQGKIFVVGNTIVDATLNHTKISLERFSEHVREVTQSKPYVLLTLHREENVDNREILTRFMKAIETIIKTYNVQVLFPVHPRTEKRLHEFQLQQHLTTIENLKMVEPVGYLTFLAYLSRAAIVMSDSGGVQEESCILDVPCITLRESTERQETVDCGANHVAGTDETVIVNVFDLVWKKRDSKGVWHNPYGDGKTAARIVDTALDGKPGTEL
jgi:UDP-N-acetylglucosamine 2-epimerase (non-hydrolysing)